MRIVRGVHVRIHRQVEIALITVDPPGELHGRVMVGVLLHPEVDIADGDLFVILMLENQHAVSDFQITNIERPAGVRRNVRSIRLTNGFGLWRKLNHRPFQHHLFNLELMG